MATKIDFKQVLLQHGERIGLIVAGVVAVLILLTSMLWPGHGMFAGSPTEKAKTINDTTVWVDSRLQDPSNLPGDNDKPPQNANTRLIAYKSDAVEGGKYIMLPLGHPTDAGPLGRRVPQVFGVVEAAAEARRVNIRAYIFSSNNEQILVLNKAVAVGGGAAAPAMPTLPPGINMAAISRLTARQKQLLGIPPNLGLDDGKTEVKSSFIAVTDLDKSTGQTLAEQVCPLPQVVIAGSFPFKKQVEEFRAKLGLRTNEDVIAETTADKAPSFRFVGVNVQRRELDADGKPITPFVDVKLNEDYKFYVIVTGRRFEPDDPALDAIAFPGLVMPKLLQFSSEVTAKDEKGMAADPKAAKAPIDPSKDQYPQVEKKLKLVGQTLQILKEKGAAAVATRPRRFTLDNFDIFSPKPANTPMPGTGTGTGTGDGAARPPTELPDYCLVRLIDVSVQPGKTYEYQLQVRMANPNFGRRDVASPTYAEKPELVSAWSKLARPITAKIEPDLYYYAVDQKDLQDGRYKGPYTSGQYNKDQMVFLQAHRWINTVRMKGDAELIVGEWAVAERFPVRRGEYAGRSERVEVPYWKFARESFVIASEAGKGAPGIDVDFGHRAASAAQPEPVLVDFESGKHTYDRGSRKVSDSQAVEALLLNPDGKLILLEGARDADDEERKNRLEKVRVRLEEVRTGKSSGKTGDRFSK